MLLLADMLVEKDGWVTGLVPMIDILVCLDEVKIYNIKITYCWQHGAFYSIYFKSCWLCEAYF